MTDMPDGVDPREWHYGEFYGHRETSGPCLMVWGNCQAEALRVLLDPLVGDQWSTVRIPAVHELTEDDLPHLERTLAKTTALIAQPVRDDYRDLPLGSAQVAERTNDARVVRIPALFWAPLHPFQVLVRGEAGDPPGVPYHDLRVLTGVPLDHRPPAGAVRTIADESREELKRRQDKDETLLADDLLTEADTAATNVINHPGNPVLIGLAGRIAEELGLSGSVADPGRELLGGLLAPIPDWVVDELSLNGEARTGWTIDGRQVSEEELAETQRAWYADHPEMIEAGLKRHAQTLTTLGLPN
ncbi:WcbI family polysaccharide biosynthesis putative acetyltransferase [Enemella evansiae]|uniref:WcbI family polysaccharide biosynthesis putative acetyltransferase n=1 Tax=Enemella evansiae TaxID=2016499 RepID=UPI00117F3740|nr:WcbI family polysaccharide biosynthesis putative acetyltransferase [Enemella evansiae]